MSGRDFFGSSAVMDRADDGDQLCAPFLSALPITGVAISTLSDPFGAETVSASDASAARLDEIQLDLGEGPCWQAMRTLTPVLEPDVQHTSSEDWPAALIALRETGLGAVFAFPMRIGAVGIGSVDLFSSDAQELPDDLVRSAVVLTEVAARQVLHRALERAEAESPGQWAGGKYSRRDVHQAAGMVSAQTGATTEDALLILRAYAYTAGQSVLELSARVLDRVVDFTDPNDSASQRGTRHD